MTDLYAEDLFGPIEAVARPQGTGSLIEHRYAEEWLAEIEPGTVTAVIFDPPYAVGTPVRGREDGAAGSVFTPFRMLNTWLRLSARTLRPGGIVAIFADWRRMPDLGYMATTVGLRASTCIAWTRTSPGTGGLLRSAWDPILIASRGTPDAIDRAAIPNVVQASYPSKKRHPYEKPVEVYTHFLQRIARPGEIILDPFAGSGNSRTAATSLGLDWRGCDIDPNYAEITPNA
ncbi:DNA methyltransferase [Streptomyces sp. NPDC006610]|uniref:DNA-methyltransferase n=1 Tax=Streptomyces sp. NPDC006610 TaxID=3154584 RepID=UPI0033A58193